MGVRSAAAGAQARARPSTRARALEGGEIAWLVAIPCALVAAVLVLVLGPPLGSLLFPPPDLHFWPSFQERLHPEPTEQARYLLALLAPLIASGAIVLALRRGTWTASGGTRAVVLGSQAVVLGLLLATIGRQLSPDYDYQFDQPYFSVVAVVFAIGFAFAAARALADERARARMAGWARETPRRRWVCLLLALLWAVVWLLTAVNTDRSITSAHWAVGGLLPWTVNDVYAVLDGRSPLVDVHAQYGSLFPYLMALPLLVLGSSLAVLTTSMAAATTVALLAIYDVLRRVTRSSVAALALFVPFVAIGFYTLIGPLDDRYAASNTFSWFPIRVAGPYLTAWLLARHLDGAWPRRTWPLFLVAGLALLNNVELGVAALGATIAALLWARSPRGWPEARAQLADAAIGLGAALAAVTVLTLVRAGSLPHLGLLTELSSLYVRGRDLEQMPAFGFQYAIYLTYAAAIVLATVRAVGGRRDLLTGMLAWSGVFGLGAAGYFVGQSRPMHLVFLFSAWALALSLLLVAVVQGIAARSSHRPTAADLAVLVAFGLTICAVAQTPAPWAQIDRVADTSQAPLWRDNAAEQFVAAGTARGEHVVILLPLGQRVAYDLGLVNVSPYAEMELIPTREQLDTTVRALREAGGTKLYYWVQRPDPGVALERAGFEMTRYDQQLGFAEWTDRSGGSAG